MENDESAYTKANSTVIVEQQYAKGLTLKDVLKEYIKQKALFNMRMY